MESLGQVSHLVHMFRSCSLKSLPPDLGSKNLIKSKRVINVFVNDICSDISLL